MLDQIHLSEDTPSIPWSERIKDPKTILVLSAALCVVISIIASMILSRLNADEPQNQSVHLSDTVSTISATLRPLSDAEKVALLKQKTREVSRLVQSVLMATKQEQYEAVTKYFLYRPDTWQTKEGVIQTLRADFSRYTKDGTYAGELSESEIQVHDLQAQVPVTHTISGKTYTSRYDLVSTRDGWKITGLVYDAAVDLSKKIETSINQEALWKEATGSAEKITYTLPAGDTIEVQKTVFTSLRTVDGAHQDIEVKVIGGKQNYIIALSNGTEIVEKGVINIEDIGTYLHVFDIRSLISSGGGVILFYPADAKISRGMLGVPGGAVFQIPIKVTL